MRIGASGDQNKVVKKEKYHFTVADEFEFDCPVGGSVNVFFLRKKDCTFSLPPSLDAGRMSM